jgi:NADPH-dependent ferric siderophore reductase
MSTTRTRTAPRPVRLSTELSTMHSSVAEARWLTPNLREVVLEGGLDDFDSWGGDQFAYLFVARPGGILPADYTMSAHRTAEPAARPLGGYYTVRSRDADRGRVTLWMVAHGHPASVGGWAATCRAGDRVALWGPRRGIEPRPDARRWLFVADECGFGAVAALLDGLPAGSTARVIAETVDEDHATVDFATAATDIEVDIEWRFRRDDAPGSGAGLLAAVTGVSAGSDVAVFGATELRSATAIRTRLRDEVGLGADQIHVTGYWRRGGW